MKKIVLLMIVIVFVAGCWHNTGSQSDGIPMDDVPIPAEEGLIAEIAFAATLEGGVHCSRDFPKGCDIYIADYDLENKEVMSVKRLTFGGGTEWFPAFVDLGSILYENWDERKTYLLSLNDLSKSILLSNARFPYIVGKKLVYSSTGGGIHIADIEGKKVRNDVVIASEPSSGDPQLSSDGSFVTYHYKYSGDKGARTKLLYLDSGESVEITEDIGCGHAAISPDDSMVICGLSSSSIIKQWDFDTLSDLIPKYDPSVFADFDARYNNCDNIIISYTEFCVKKDYIIGSVQCTKETGAEKPVTEFSQLFLFDISEDFVMIHSIHNDFEDFLGVSGKESVTAACRNNYG